MVTKNCKDSGNNIYKNFKIDNKNTLLKNILDEVVYRQGFWLEYNLSFKWYI